MYTKRSFRLIFLVFLASVVLAQMFSCELSNGDTPQQTKHENKDVIELDLGTIYSREKKIVLNEKGIYSAEKTSKRKEFFEKALSYFPSLYYVDFYFGYGSHMYVFKDTSGKVQSIRSESRMDMGGFERDHERMKDIENSYTKITLENDTKGGN